MAMAAAAAGGRAAAAGRAAGGATKAGGAAKGGAAAAGPVSGGEIAGTAADLAKKPLHPTTPPGTPQKKPKTPQQPAGGEPPVQGGSEPQGGDQGGFWSGVRDGASQGRKMAPRTGRVNDGAGVLLGFLLWVWVVLPFLAGGKARVNAVLRAKFMNKGPDGELP